MKKILSLFIIPVISLFFVTEVKAEERYLEFNEDFSLIQEKITSIGSEKFNYGINTLIDYYKNNYKDEYSYYSISIFVDGNDRLNLIINIGNEENFNDIFLFTQSIFSYYDIVQDGLGFKIYYDESSSSFSEIIDSTFGLSLFEFNSSNNYIYPYNYYYSNFDFYYLGSNLSEIETMDDGYYSLTYLSVDDTLYVPLYDNSTTYAIHNATEDFLIEPYYLYDENSTLEPDVDIYTTVDLNNYSYVALSLKDYDVEAFDSTFYVKGQLCPTVVYNYGLEERLNTDRCNIAYSDFTPIRYRISATDIENHFIYYFKPYDTSIENKVKVDTSIFNIHYITEEEKDNPILDINGHKYSAIPFDSLPTTANKNELDNFVPGASEELTFDGFFDKPLEALKSVWGAITSVFALITEFIVLLPPTMQGFLYISFGITIALGLLKILL